MAMDAVLLYSVGPPLTGASVAWLSAYLSWSSAKNEAETPPRLATLGVFLQLPAVSVLFGVTIYVLSGIWAERVPVRVLDAAAMAMGVPALLTGLAFAMLFHQGIPVAVRSRGLVARVTAICTLPMTCVLFGFATAFLLCAPSGESGLAVLPENAERAALYFGLGSLATPVQAVVMSNMVDYGDRGKWLKAIAAGVACEVVLLVAFALAYLTMR